MTTKARRALSWLGCVSLWGLALGCSSQSSETKRQLETLNERLLILQNDRDRLVERVDALEARVSKPSGEADETDVGTNFAGRPPLKVVRLEPAPNAETESNANAPEGSAPTDGVAAPSKAVDNGGVNADEPKVVLYGEGGTSGVRASSEGVTNP